MNNEKLNAFVCRSRLLLLIAGGILTALPVIFPKVGFIAWIGGVPAAVAFMNAARDDSVRLRKMYGYGFAFFMALYSLSFHWFIAMYPLSFVDGMSKPEAMAVVLVATFGLGALQSSFSALFGVLLALAARKGVCKRRPILLAVTAGVLYPIFEWAQTFTWAGVPWARLAASQVEWTAMLKTVSFFGPYFLSALIVTVNFLLAELVLTKAASVKRICAAAAALLIAVSTCAGGISAATYKDGGREVTVAAVQPNLSSLDPWGFDTVDEAMEILREYSLDAATYGAELIVWPETIFPLDFREGSDIWEFSVDLAKECGATIVVGSFTQGAERDRNSLIFISPDGSVNDTVYSKRRLVPFGEFVPWRDFFDAVMPELVDLMILSCDLESSEKSNVAHTDVGELGGIICFDSIYETLSLNSVRDGAELLVLSTNDSWFTGSRALEMHAAQARLRAAETGRYVVRSASTGISMVITPLGEVMDSVPELEGGYAIATVRLRDGRTLYSTVGNTFTYLSIAFVAVMLLWDPAERLIRRMRAYIEKNI